MKVPSLSVSTIGIIPNFWGRMVVCFCSVLSLALAEAGAPVEKFQQLDQTVPTPSAQRIASGAPGAACWQNRADYDISVELDDVKRTISAEA